MMMTGIFRKEKSNLSGISYKTIFMGKLLSSGFIWGFVGNDLASVTFVIE